MAVEFNLETGLCKEMTVTVAPEHTAKSLGSGGVEVLSTPMLIALMEGAAQDALQARLPEGWTTVGTRVDIEHLAATPVGMAVTARARLIEVAGRRLVFAVEAHDEQEQVGRGQHERFIVNASRFESKTRAKAGL
ncbi:MAG: thioesterase family protein [bacterium]|jgi:fluoroacetyl-CoA thioesterase